MYARINVQVCVSQFLVERVGMHSLNDSLHLLLFSFKCGRILQSLCKVFRQLLLQGAIMSEVLYVEQKMMPSTHRAGTCNHTHHMAYTIPSYSVLHIMRIQ